MTNVLGLGGRSSIRFVVAAEALEVSAVGAVSATTAAAVVDLDFVVADFVDFDFDFDFSRLAFFVSPTANPFGTCLTATQHNTRQ
jgi:hypothetical protein